MEISGGNKQLQWIHCATLTGQPDQISPAPRFSHPGPMPRRIRTSGEPMSVPWERSHSKRLPMQIPARVSALFAIRSQKRFRIDSISISVPLRIFSEFSSNSLKISRVWPPDLRPIFVCTSNFAGAIMTEILHHQNNTMAIRSATTGIFSTLRGPDVTLRFRATPIEFLLNRGALCGGVVRCA